MLCHSFLARRQSFSVRSREVWFGREAWQEQLSMWFMSISVQSQIQYYWKKSCWGHTQIHLLFFLNFLICYCKCFVVDFFNFFFFFEGRAFVCLTAVFLASSLLNDEIWTQLKSLHSVNLERDEPLWSWWKNSQFDIPGISEGLFISFNSTRISLGILDNWSVKINFQSFWKINIMIFTQFYSWELSVLQKSVP